MRSNAHVRFPLLLLLGAIASFALAFTLWPSLDDGHDLAPPDATQSEAGNGRRTEDDGNASRTSVDNGPERTGSAAALVRIVVTSTAGFPIADCDVKVAKLAVQRTDENGIVQAEVRPGRHWVEVRPLGADPQSFVRQRVTAVRGEVVTARIVLAATGGGEIWCRVVAAENGAPIEGANVSAYPYGGAEQNTDQDGLVALQIEGEHEFLVAKTEGRAVRRILSVAENFGEDGVLEVPLPLAAELKVKVVGSDEEPVAGTLVVVTAMPWSLMHPTRSTPRGEAETWTAETDEKGMCGFADLPPACALLLEATSVVGGHSAFRESIQLTTGANERTIQLGSLGSIVGRVLDAAGTPVPAARVAAVRLFDQETMEFLPEDAHTSSTISETDGSYRIEGLEPGSYAIALHATEGWASKCSRVELPTGGSAKADLRAVAALSIRGTLTGPGNRPISAFEVHAMKGDTIVGSSVTNRQGEFSIESLVPGDYTIFTELYDHNLAMREPIVVPAGRSGVAVQVASVMGTLRGRIIGGDSLRPDTFLRAQHRGGLEAAAGRCDLDGRFEHGSVREGVWDLHVTDGAGRVGVASGVRVVAQESTPEIEIALMPGAWLRPSHPNADKFIVMRGEETVAFGPLERGLPGQTVVPPGKCTVVFYVRGREVSRKDAVAALGQHTIVEVR